MRRVAVTVLLAVIMVFSSLVVIAEEGGNSQYYFDSPTSTLIRPEDSEKPNCVNGYVRHYNLEKKYQIILLGR